MAKKKSSKKLVPLAGYIPADVLLPQGGTIYPNVNQYPDVGVSFEGYAKATTGKILRQLENSITIRLGTNLAGLGAGTYTINRGHNDQNYIFSDIKISYIQTGLFQTIALSDSNGTNSIQLDLCGTSATIGDNVQINIIPKLFQGNDIKIVIVNAIPINEFISISIYGWYEDKP